MSTQNYKTIIVVGIMYDEDDAAGSSVGREGAKSHDAAIELYLKWLASTSLSYVAVEWGDHVEHPRFLAASDPIPEIPSATEAAERSPEPAQTTPAKDSG